MQTMKRVSYGSLKRILCFCLVIIMTLALFRSALVSAGSVTISIGDTSFSSDEDVSSGWKDGKGWKNLAGKYVAMVDFDGSDTVVSADGGSVTLAVAGVNRIGTLKGNCSFNIAGTGIILIDSIDIGSGTISLMPDTSLYDEGSAALFLKQDDGSYMLINGSIPGILDESYEIKGVSLIMPSGSSLILKALGVRSETYISEDSGELVTDERTYRGTIPWQDFDPEHEAGIVEVKAVISTLLLDKNSTLTVGKGAQIKLEEITSVSLGNDFRSTASRIDTAGTVDIRGTAGGGFINVSGGSLKGNGTISDSEIDINGGALSKDLKIENSGLTLSGDSMTVSADINNSVIYLKGSSIRLDELKVKGTSYIGINSTGVSVRPAGYGSAVIGDVIFADGGSLDIVCNDHPYVAYGNDHPRYAEDCLIKVEGTVTGGKIRALAGMTEYTGSGKDGLPIAPGGYASRVLIRGQDIDSSDYPLNMSLSDAEALAGNDTIHVMYMTVIDTLISDKVNARKWSVDSYYDLEPLTRDSSLEFTSTSFLELYGIEGSLSSMTYCTAVEVIYSDLSRERFFIDDDTVFGTENVILIRVIDCIGSGSQGGSAITQTATSFTGNGNLGGAGNGNVTSGKGTTVYPIGGSPESSATAKPTASATAKPTASATTKPTASATARPTVKPTASATPKPTGKATAGPTATPYRSNGTGEEKTSETGSELVPVVSVKENGSYVLKVYRNGGEIKDLSGEKVKVRLPDTEGAKESDILYAVFGEGKDAVYIKAEYDTDKEGFMFSTGITGRFRTAAVSVTEVRYPSLGSDDHLFMNMRVMIGDEEINELPQAIEAVLPIEYDTDSADGLYAVFVNEKDETAVFTVYPYSAGTGHRFLSDKTGNFVIVRLSDTFRNENELKDACLASEEVRIMLAVTRLARFWS